MSRLLGVVCAGVLLVSAGCSADLLRVAFLGPGRPQLVVAGSVVDVACRLEGAMADAGISYMSKSVDGDLRLAGQSKTGKVFCFHLWKEPGPGADRTRITLQWDREADEDFWRTIVLPLAKTAPAQG
jgi:hypothetical protein